MNSSWEKVREFHVCFNHPVKESPVQLLPERVQKRLLWMREELDEFETATDISGQADAMIDLMYFALGTMVEMGVKPEKLFDIVHNANMQKLFPDGKPHYNADGKTIKPITWKDPEPEIVNELEAQMRIS
jgi:predicted HAD superfamily Cof-like phosphohydrolase